MPEPGEPEAAAVTIGVSLKLYLGVDRTAAWCDAVAEIADHHPAIVDGTARLFVLPSLPMLALATAAFAGTAVEVGAQDLFWADRGPYTGGVSGIDLVDLGCRFVEIGHAERRAVFGEDEQVVGRKLAAAFRTGLRPVLCLGEPERTSPERAAAFCIDRLASRLDAAPPSSPTPLVVAYEPEWAIGAAAAAAPGHVRQVAAGLRSWLSARPEFTGSAVIYGGSAGPGTLTELAPDVDGLFLGRFAHDPAALERIIDEVQSPRPARGSRLPSDDCDGAPEVPAAVTGSG